MKSVNVFRPMLYSTPMVQALMNGTKTQTRRQIKDAIRVEKVPQYLEYKDDWDKYMVGYSNYQYKLIKSSVNIGDIIWVRETFQHTEILNINPEDENYGFVYKADSQPWEDYEGWVWKPSLFMPKDACRLWLKVTNVRVERLQDISEEDAENEGLEKDYSTFFDTNKEYSFPDYNTPRTEIKRGKKVKISSGLFKYAVDSYKSLWQKINGKDSWDANPFVWVYDFEVISEAPYGFR